MSSGASGGTHDRRSRNMTFRQFLISEAKNGEVTHSRRIVFLWRSRSPGNRWRRQETYREPMKRHETEKPWGSGCL